MEHLKGDPAYVGAFMEFLSEQQDDDAIVRIAMELLKEQTEPASRALLLRHAAHAAYQRTDYDLADGFLAQLPSTEATADVHLRAQIDWARGLADLAVLRLTDHVTAHPDDATARGLLGEYQRLLGRIPEWHATVVAGLAAHPLAPEFRIQQLRVLNHQAASDRQ